ncbi:hypothetical protein JW868_02165 [Candidatus Woesearchaeota archaeon]|nr:hypothetical protein [Candidatus Woesearchaeota archaeon]
MNKTIALLSLLIISLFLLPTVLADADSGANPVSNPSSSSGSGTNYRIAPGQTTDSQAFNFLYASAGPGDRTTTQILGIFTWYDPYTALADTMFAQKPWIPMLGFVLITLVIMLLGLGYVPVLKDKASYKLKVTLGLVIAGISLNGLPAIRILATLGPTAFSWLIIFSIIAFIVMSYNQTSAAWNNSKKDKLEAASGSAQAMGRWMKDKDEREQVKKNIDQGKKARKEIERLMNKDFKNLLDKGFEDKLDAARKLIHTIQKLPDQNGEEAKKFLDSAKKYVASAFTEEHTRQQHIQDLQTQLSKVTRLEITNWQKYSEDEESLVTAIKTMAEHNTKRTIDEKSQRMHAIRNIAKQIINHNAEVASLNQHYQDAFEVVENIGKDWVQINQNIVTALESNSLEEAVGTINKALQLHEKEELQLQKMLKLQIRMREIEQTDWQWMNDNNKILRKIGKGITSQQATGVIPKGDTIKEAEARGEKKIIDDLWNQIKGRFSGMPAIMSVIGSFSTPQNWVDMKRVMQMIVDIDERTKAQLISDMQKAESEIRTLAKNNTALQEEVKLIRSQLSWLEGYQPSHRRR